LLNYNFNQESFFYYFKIIKNMIYSFGKNKEYINNYYELIFEIFKNCFDIRRLIYEKNSEILNSLLDSSKCELLIIETFIELIMKLNDEQMINLIKQLIYWIETNE